LDSATFDLRLKLDLMIMIFKNLFLFISISIFTDHAFAQPAEPGNCIRFNGSNGLATVTTAQPSGDASLMGWFSPNVLNNPSSTFGNQGLFGFRNDQSFYILMLPNGRIEYRITINGASGTINSTRFACVNGWFHVAMVYRQQEGRLEAYFNGELQNSISVGSGNFIQNTRLFTLARQQFSNQNFWFNGRMDNVALINRALSQDEIYQFASQEVIDNPADMMLYFKFNQTSGSTLIGETAVNMSLSGGYFWEESNFPVMLASGANTYTEQATNDGSLSNDDALILNLHRTTFNANVSDDLIADNKAIVDNLPAGLTARLEVLSNSSAQLTLLGNADMHDELNSLENIHVRLFEGALNEFCNGFAYPINIQFISCELPVAEIQASQAQLCPGSSVNLVASGGTTYNWSTGFSGAEYEITVNETTTLEVYVSLENGCGEDTAAITLETYPIIPLVINPSGPVTICQGQTVELSASADFVNYQWSHGPQINPVVVPLAGNYTVTATDVNGCFATSNSVSVEIAIFENLTLNGNFFPVENNESVYFVEASPSYDFTFGVTGGQVISQQANQLIVNWGNSGQGSIWFFAQDENACISDTIFTPINIQISTSVDKLKSNRVAIAPNPATDELNLLNLKEDGQFNIIIRDIKGQIVQRHTIRAGAQKINIQSLVSGIYLLQCEEQNLNIHFIKQ